MGFINLEIQDHARKPYAFDVLEKQISDNADAFHELTADERYQIAESDFVPDGNFCNNPNCDSCIDEIRAQREAFEAAL